MGESAVQRHEFPMPRPKSIIFRYYRRILTRKLMMLCFTTSKVSIKVSGPLLNLILITIDAY